MENLKCILNDILSIHTKDNTKRGHKAFLFQCGPLNDHLTSEYIKYWTYHFIMISQKVT